MPEVNQAVFSLVLAVIEDTNRVGVRGVDFLAPNFAFNIIRIFLAYVLFLNTNLRV